jgi:L-Ala-D/L-Glu epimerase
MKIAGAEVFKVSLPLIRSYADSSHAETASHEVIVKLMTDEGIVGYGEASPRSTLGDTQGTTVQSLIEVFLPLLIGKDPFTLEAILVGMDQALRLNYPAKNAIDLALHDIQGKALGQPVCNLLGGCFRKEVPSFELIPLMPPEESRGLVEEALSSGIRDFKTKVGNDQLSNIERVKAVRGAMSSQGSLSLDANMSWSPKRAIRFIRELEVYGVDIVEQPVPPQDLEGLTLVTRSVDVLVSADESATWEMAPELARRRAVDILHIKLNRVGGLCRAKKLATMAHQMGMMVECGGFLQGMLVEAAFVHLYASTPEIFHNEAGKGLRWHKEDPASGLKVINGQIQVPQKPGLGIEMDEGYLRRFRVASIPAEKPR